MTHNTNAETANEVGGSKVQTPDRDVVVRGLKDIAMIMYVFKPEYVQVAFDAIELLTGEKIPDGDENL